jgi:hypothetical protein
MEKTKKYLVFINSLNEKTYSGINNDFNIQETGNNVLETVEKIEKRIKEEIVNLFLKGKKIPESVDLQNTNKYSGKSFFIVSVDPVYEAAKVSGKLKKKTLTIPEWIDVLATERKVNFSQVLYKALKKELGIEN